MSSESEFGKDVGLLHELVLAGRRAGWDRNTYAALRENISLMRQIPELLAGRAAVTTELESLIYCDAEPYIPDGWKVIEHNKDGIMRWSSVAVRIWASDEQDAKRRCVTDGHRILEDIRSGGLHPLNACALDHLIEKGSKWFPEECVGICFWGTIYELPDGERAVRCIEYDRYHRRQAGYKKLDSRFDWNYLAVVHV